MILPGVELAVCPAYGWQGGPEFETLVKRLRSGHERRRPLWGTVKHRYALPFQNIGSDEYLTDLKSIYLAAMGQAHSFLVKDFSDFEAVNEVFGVGDGDEVAFDLLKTYAVGAASYTRRILFPVDATFYVNGTPADAEFDPDSRKVVFDTAPADQAVLSWSGEFRVLVRFASDAFPMTIDNRMGDVYAMNGSVELMEVWE